MTPLCYADWGKRWLHLIFSDLAKNTALAFFFNLKYKFVVPKALQLFSFTSSKDLFCQTFYPVLPKGPFKYYVIKKVGGWGRQNAYVCLQGGWVGVAKCLRNHKNHKKRKDQIFLGERLI